MGEVCLGGDFLRQIVINDKYIKEEDIDKVVVRVKAFVVNSRGKVLLAHNNNTYQFPGGHLDEGEDINRCIEREIKEETGIELNVLDEPFLNIVGYYDEYFGTECKVKCSNYYFRVVTDEVPDYSKTHYDELEIKTEFNLYYISLSGLGEFLENCIKDNSINEKIAKEMLLAYNEYKEEFGGI